MGSRSMYSKGRLWGWLESRGVERPLPDEPSYSWCVQTSGLVQFNGQVITSTSVKGLRQQMQIIFQDPFGSMNPRMTIESMVTEPMVIQGFGTSKKDRMDKAAALLEEVGMLPEHLKRYPHEFSGGQRQRICIARALAVERIHHL